MSRNAMPAGGSSCGLTRPEKSAHLLTPLGTIGTFVPIRVNCPFWAHLWSWPTR